MNGIDVSNWQHGIDISKVPCDFVISKATEGINYTNPDCDRVIQQCIHLGKCWGVYHYINGTNGEIDYFVKSISGYISHGIIALDWERQGNHGWGNLAYLEQCINRVIELTGVRPIIYASKSQFPWELCKKYDCGTWVAQYANNARTGYQQKPWGNGAYAIFQYSANGRLTGYNGSLDLDIANMSAEQWKSYANPSGAKTPATTPSADIEQMAQDAIRGKYGTGDERKRALGGNYQRVQDRVNQILDIALAAKRGDYGNGVNRRNALGTRYEIVQYCINHKMV